MSGYTMTQAELLYSADLAGSATSTGSTAIQSAIAGYPPVVVPGGFFANVGSYRTSALLVQWRGLLIATATVPTFTISFVSNTSDTFAATSTWVTSGTFTPTANTGTWFECELHVACRTLPAQSAQGALTTSATVSAHGVFRLLGSATASETTQVNIQLPAAASSYSPAGTIDTSIQQYLYPCLTLGTATAGNTLTSECFKMWGLN